MSEQLENIKQENAKLKEQIEELISNEQEALDNLDNCNKDNKKIRKEYKNSQRKYEDQIRQLKSEHENKISTIIEHENTIIGLKEDQREINTLRNELEEEKKKRKKLKREFNELCDELENAHQQLEHNFEENKIESQEVRSSSQKYKQKTFKLEENTIFIENINPLKSRAEVIAVPLSMNWDYKSGIAKHIMQAAGQEVIEMIKDIKSQDDSERVGTIEYTTGGEIKHLLFNTKCLSLDEMNNENKDKWKVPLQKVLKFLTEQTDQTSICIPIMIYGDIPREILSYLIREYYKILVHHSEKYQDKEQEIHFCAEDKYTYRKLCDMIEYNNRWSKKMNSNSRLVMDTIKFD